MRTSAAKFFMTAMIVVAMLNPAAAETDLSFLAKYVKGGKIDAAALQKDYDKQKLESSNSKTKTNKKIVNFASSNIPAINPPIVEPLANIADPESELPDCVRTKPKGAFQCLLRRNFSDIYLFDRATPRASAQGAEVAYTRDFIEKDSLWSTHAAAAVVYRVMGSVERPYLPILVGMTIAPFVQIDKEIHSNRKFSSRDVDTLVAGATGEVGLRAFGGQHFIRGRFAAVADRIDDTTSARAVLEWLPIYEQCIGFPCSFGTPFVFNFQPELKIQYDTISGRNAFLGLNDRNESLRIGPEFTLIARPQFVPETLSFLRDITGRLTYHWSEDIFSGRRFTWLDSAIVYNLDPNGFFALVGSYRRGNEEETGQRTGILKVGLTGKI